VTLTDEMENREAEYYLQASVLKSGVCDCGMGDLVYPSQPTFNNYVEAPLNSGCSYPIYEISPMEKSQGLGLFNVLHKFFAEMDSKFLSGFLGQIPTDIWSKLYTLWLKLAGAKIEKGSVVHYKVRVWKPENINIGKGVSVPASTDMAGMSRIKIGDYTLIGANVSFITNNHPLEDENLSWQEVLIGTQQDINVGKFCWLMNDTKLIAGRRGLSINDFTWTASGSTVVKDIGKAELWGGSPAKFIRKIHIHHEK